jgi:hypothetical protein
MQEEFWPFATSLQSRATVATERVLLASSEISDFAFPVVSGTLVRRRPVGVKVMTEVVSVLRVLEGER